MAPKSMIIIGAGLAGLATGCYARMNGYEARIFELHNIPGGVCTDWQRKGYTFDGCIHFLMGCLPSDSTYRLYQETGALKATQFKTRKGFNSLVSDKTGQSLAVTDDLDQLARDMKELAPEDEAVIDEFINGCKSMQDFDLGLPKPRELMGVLDNIKLLWDMRGHLKDFGRYSVPVCEFAKKIKDPFLRDCINYMFLPEMPLVVLFMFLGQLSAGKLGYIEGGSRKFAEAIAASFESQGGEITYRAEVEEILVENDRAVGVRLVDGSEYKADVVVSAADGHSTIFQMLKGRYIDREIQARYDKWPLFAPIVTVSFGVAGKFPDQLHTQTLLFEEPVNISGKEITGLMVRIFDYDSSLAPAGNTVVQVIYETDYDYWINIRQDRSRYDGEKAAAARFVLAKLEALLPGIESRVEVTDVATPYTFWRYTRNYRGAYEGWLMTPEMLKGGLPKTLPGLANFYMAGQWVEPGGGIPSALYSGRNVLQIICDKDGKQFVSNIIP